MVRGGRRMVEREREFVFSREFSSLCNVKREVRGDEVRVFGVEGVLAYGKWCTVKERREAAARSPL